ncbi:hypothetical protein [Sphaerisporangium perillae]|uniref:hypothetical protein n=1 Tax=Sphaerisporangium perillae TaxID=2935860 RepID=UPI00200CB9C7|nr:hypothetical protein [Sphaerisporangium perillae]
MGVIHGIGGVRQAPALKDAIGGFLAGVSNPNTARAYATALRERALWRLPYESGLEQQPNGQWR